MDIAIAPTWDEAPPTLVDPPHRRDGSSERPAVGGMSAERFGDYWLIARLGRGGMGEVFVARHVQATVDGLCVLKRMHAGLEQDPTYVDMFFDEGRVASHLRHPCLVQTYELGEADGSPYIAMEYLHGQPLSRINSCARQWWGGLPVEAAVRVCCDVLAGLHHAHEARDAEGRPLDIVHRDVTPGNVFVTYEGDVKVLDFGIARAASRLSQTQSGQLKGKFAYVAPEYVRGPDVDRRADVWNVGVLLWESLTGRRLFQADGEADTLRAVLRQPIPSLHEELGLPWELDRILWRALQRDPDLRYPTAERMRADLERFLLRFAPEYDRAELATQMREWFDDDKRRDAQVLDQALGVLSVGAELAEPPPTESCEAHRDGGDWQVRFQPFEQWDAAEQEEDAPVEPAASSSDANDGGCAPAEPSATGTDCEQGHEPPQVLWMLFAAVAATVLSGALTAL